MSENTKPNYSDFVAALAKNPIEIIQSLDPRKAHMWHMQTGINGEYLEILQALAANDSDNLKEEIGDMFFYFQGLVQCFPQLQKEDFEANTLRLLDTNNAYLQLCQRFPKSTLLDEIELACDLVKKIVLYEKADILSSHVFAPIERAITHLGNLAKAHGFTLQDAFDHNRVKLGERYVEGTFTNSQAQERADKQEES